MKSISSLSAVISMVININIATECLPNGCYYDLSLDLTKKIECKPDGHLEILNFHGNNGCDNLEYYLPDLTYNSPVGNVCCEPDEISPCDDSHGCKANEYCLNHTCVDNPCNVTNFGTHICENNAVCSNGCYCWGLDTYPTGKCIPIPQEPAIRCNVQGDCARGQYCNNGLCVHNPCPATHPDGTHLCLSDEVCSNNNVQCYCSSSAGGLEQRCIPGNPPIPVVPINELDEELDLVLRTGQSYSVTVKNLGSYSGPIGIFETSPSDQLIFGGYPIIFAAHPISSGQGSIVRFDWTMQWGLSWFDGSLHPDICQPDEPDSDIIYSRHGQIINVSPSNPSDNGAAYHYNNGAYTLSLKPNSNLNGQLQVSTDDSFTVSQAQSDCFNLLVTLDNDPVFVIPGEPSSIITYDIEPKYYLSTVKNVQGETVSATAVSESYQIQFPTGIYDITVCLDDTLQFQPCPSSDSLLL